MLFNVGRSGGDVLRPGISFVRRGFAIDRLTDSALAISGICAEVHEDPVDIHRRNSLSSARLLGVVRTIRNLVVIPYGHARAMLPY